MVVWDMVGKPMVVDRSIKRHELRTKIWREVFETSGIVCSVLWVFGQFLAAKPMIRWGGGFYLIQIMASWRYESFYSRVSTSEEFDTDEWPMVWKWLVRPIKYAVAGGVLFVMFPPV